MRNLIVILLFFIRLSVCAQSHDLHGRLYGPKNEPASFVQGALADGRRGTSSDSAGNFCIKDLTPGKYKIQMAGVGYKRKEVTVVLPSSTLKIILEEDKNELE